MVWRRLYVIETMNTTFEPAYVKLLRDGQLIARAKEAYQRFASCDFCGWRCRVDRIAGKLGVCRTGDNARVSSYGLHMGEENPLRGWRGSGTIFFTRCNLRCQYCQNHDISQTDSGDLVSAKALALMMLELQSMGCHNINLVSPTHVVPQILAAVNIAARAGLRLPLVYNTGGYDSLTALQLLEDVVDIYMPDMKYSSERVASYYSKCPRYPQVNQAAITEMYRQVGDLQMDLSGVAQRGLLVRHLILPNRLAGTNEIVHFLADEVSKNTYLNLMNQYHPDFLVRQYPNQYSKLNRSIKASEFHEALDFAEKAGLYRFDK